MDRRAFLMTASATTVASIAGCSGDSNSPDGDSGGSSTDSPTDSPTESAEPASFTVERWEGPDEVAIGAGFTLTLEVTNDGGQSGTFSSPVFARTSESDWADIDSTAEVKVPAGETVTEEFELDGYDYMTTLSYRLEETGDVAEINIVSQTLAFGRGYKNPDGVTMYATGIEFADSYSWSSGDYDYEENPDDGHKWAYLSFTAENTAGQPEYLPTKHDISLLVDKNQYDYELNRDDSNVYEGGEVQAGVVREGEILYQVPENTAVEDIRVAWSEQYYEGNVAVYWSADA